MRERKLQRVYYVEDDQDIRALVKMSLERIGHLTVETEPDPFRAIQGIRTFQPDLILLDWMIPGLDGPSLMQAIRAEHDLSQVPVVFITAKASTEESNLLAHIGAAGVIHKPFAPVSLANQLNDIWQSIEAKST